MHRSAYSISFGTCEFLSPGEGAIARPFRLAYCLSLPVAFRAVAYPFRVSFRAWLISRSCGSCCKCAVPFSFRKTFREIFFTRNKIAPYICRMEKILTPAQAWAEFYKWALDKENGPDISYDNRRYLMKTNLDMEAGKCGNLRLKNIFERFAPGRFKFIDLSGFIPQCSYCGGSGFDPYPGHSTTLAPCPECKIETDTD